MEPDTLRFSKEHEWVSMEDGDERLVGITDFAQEELGDVVYVNLPGVGETLTQFGRMGEVESVKAVSDLFCPVSGEVVEVNGELEDHPELVNQDPFGGGWLIKVRLANAADLDNLMSNADYRERLEESD